MSVVALYRWLKPMVIESGGKKTSIVKKFQLFKLSNPESVADTIF
jgi:hypothetical protein